VRTSSRSVAARSPGIHVLATSREPLGIIGERIYRVSSLALPPDEKPITAYDALAYDGVRFFVTRAEEAASFVLDDANARTVVHIARRLDGIPLAIELATARLRAMTVQQLGERLDASFRVLSGGSRTALPRQQTLRALIDWSYQLSARRSACSSRGSRCSPARGRSTVRSPCAPVPTCRNRRSTSRWLNSSISRSS